MITDLIINILTAPIYLLFELFSLPVVDNLEIPENVFSYLTGFVANVGYFFPIKVMLFMLIFSEVLDHFTIVWALINKIKSFIPGMGG